MTNVYIPPEIQESVFSYLMHSSAKGLAFKMEIQWAWFKVNFQRLVRATDTRSRGAYDRELDRLFLDIDQLPDLTDEMRMKFHKVIENLHYDEIDRLTYSRLWRITWFCFHEHTIQQVLHDNLKEHFMTGCILEGGTYIGYLLLNHEMNENEVMNLLSPSLEWLHMLGREIRMYSVGECSVNWSLLDEIREHRGIVSFGHWQLFERHLVQTITLKYPTSISERLLRT